MSVPAFRSIAALAIACTASVAAIAAIETGRTTDGTPFVVGGNSPEERARLESEGVRHVLSIRTISLESGSYLGGVDLTITDSTGRTVFAGRLEGPWLLIDLKPGAYRVVGEIGESKVWMNVTVPAKGRRSLVLYFRTNDASGR